MSDGKTNFLAKLTQKSTISFKQLIACSAASHVCTKGTGAMGTTARRVKARCARMERSFNHMGTIRTGTVGAKLTTKMKFLCGKLE